MTFHVAITYYNRPGMLHDLLCDIERERGDHEVRVHVYDDHSTSHINTDDLAHINKLVRFNTHGGKQKYYRSIQTALQDAHANPCDYIIFMQDDNRLATSFFDRASSTWDAVRHMDPSAACMNLWLDVQRMNEAVWTNTHRVLCEASTGPVWRTQWTEPTFITDKTFFDTPGMIPNVNPSRWNANPALSSGVGTYISTRLHAKGYSIYQVADSLLYHGDHESLMNPIARKSRSLHSKWWPGKR